MKPWEKKYNNQSEQKPWEQNYSAEKEKRFIDRGIGEIAQTVGDQASQGATFNMSDEVRNFLPALTTSISNGVNPLQMFGAMNKVSNEEMDRQREEMPITSGISQVGGALATGLGAAGTKQGKAAIDFFGRGSLASRAGKGAAASTSYAALSRAGSADSGERFKEAGDVSILDPVVGAAIPATGAILSRALTKKSPIPNADKIRKRAGDLYKSAEEKGGLLKSEFTNSFIDEIEKLTPQTDIGKIVGGDNAFSKVIGRISAIRDKPITLRAAQELDELLGDAIDDFVEAGRVTKQGKKLLDVQNTLRNMINEADETIIEGGKEGFEAVKQGRKLWSTSRKLDDIERIIQRAEQMDNPATGIRTGFRTLLNNPNRIRGYSPEERAAIKKAAETGIITDTMKVLGSRLIPIITTASGGGLGAGATAMAGSAASRNIASAAQVSKAKDVARIVAKTADDVFKMIDEGRTIAPKTIKALPTQEKKKFLSRIMTLPAVKVNEIFSSKK